MVSGGGMRGRKGWDVLGFGESKAGEEVVVYPPDEVRKEGEVSGQDGQRLVQGI